MLKPILTSAYVALAAPSAFAATWVADPGHTEVTVSWGHIGFSTQSMEFLRFEGALTYEDGQAEAASADFSVLTDSIHTGNEMFDGDIMGENFFDAVQFPAARFVSSSVEQTGESTVKVTGDLTVKDNTNEVTFDVTVNKIGENPLGQFFDYYKGTWMGITATAEVSRAAFGLGAFDFSASDTVTITINSELKAQE